jgi:hypothetical protein
VLALSQENRRFLSCHGQINCKSFPPSKSMAPRLHGRAYCKKAPRSRCPALRPRADFSCEQTDVSSLRVAGGLCQNFIASDSRRDFPLQNSDEMGQVGRTGERTT